MSYVGKRVRRTDAADKVTGRAVFGSDVRLPGMLHGAVRRSPHPHARIVSIDTRRAAAAPRVRVVVTGRDFPFTFGASIQDQPFLAIDRVRFVGEPVAAVAAETELQAQQACELIAVEYEELPAVLDPRAALADDAPLVHPGLHAYRRGPHEIVAHTNVCTLARFVHGDVAEALRAADFVFEDEFSAHGVGHAALETHAAVAQYDPGSGGYTVWVSSDRPFQLRAELASALGLPSSRVRVMAGQVGGSFGGKNTLVAEAPAVALARFAAGRPVRVEMSREEDLTASEMRMPAIIRLTTGVRRDGTLLARRADLLWDGGAYASNAVGIAIRGPKAVFGPYRIPHIEYVSRMVYTNKQVTGSYRGYGTTQAAWACESQMDVIAHRLGIDPLALRLHNAYGEGDPWHNGQILHGLSVVETLERASAEIGWGVPPSAPAPHLRRGKGVATMIKETATPTSTNVVVKMEQDGQVSVLCAAPEIGAGQGTVLAQMAADSIGVSLEAVSLPATDTATTPYNGPVASSRTTFHAGRAIATAGGEVRRRVLALAAESLGTDAEQLELRDGVVYEGGTRRATLREVLGAFGPEGCSVVAEARYSSAGSPLLKADPGAEWGSSIFHMIATQAVEIEVDTETGVVRVLRVAAAADVGRAINPAACEQQIEGGVIMGLSNALFEEFHWEGGRIADAGFTDYKLATMADTPEIVPILVESEHPEAPFGAKGIGEPAAAATAPAIANALYDALGVRIHDLPITPAKVLAAIRAGRAPAGPGTEPPRSVSLRVKSSIIQWRSPVPGAASRGRARAQAMPEAGTGATARRSRAGSPAAAGDGGAQPVQAPMLGDQVRDLLLGRILAGEFAPGARIVETRIARELGISQGPVREALRDLTTLGLVQLEPYRGARVRRPTTGEIQEAMGVRAELEAMAAAEACPRITAAHLADLRRIVSGMVELAAAGDLEAYVRQNTEFHRTVVQLSGNRTLERLWEMLVPFARTYMTAAASGLKAERVHRSHARVVGALASGDPQKAAAAMQEHLREAQGLLGSRDVAEAGGAADLATRRAGASQPGRRTR